MINMKQKARGFSLLELLLVVGVGAVLILAGLSAYRLVSENNNTNQAQRQLTTLKQQIQQTFSGEANYPADLRTPMNSLRALPADMAIVTATAGRLKGTFDFVDIAGTGATFTITFLNLPPAACSKLASMFHNSRDSDFVSVSVATAAVADPTLANTTAACAATTATKTVVWTFR